MLRTVVLHGALGERFGGPFSLDVASPAEAVRALVVQIKGFRDHVRNGHYRVIRKRNAREREIDESSLTLRLGTAKELHIVPVVSGAASGLGKTIAGIALIAAAIFLPAASFALGAFTIGVNTTIGAIGVSLALSGVAQMLSPAPQTQNGSAAQDQRESFLFGGQVNVTTQGGPVPLVYGRFLVGSVLVSAGLAVEQI